MRMHCSQRACSSTTTGAQTRIPSYCPEQFDVGIQPCTLGLGHVPSVPLHQHPPALPLSMQVHRAICKPLQQVCAVKKMNLESLNCDLVSHYRSCSGAGASAAAAAAAIPRALAPAKQSHKQAPRARAPMPEQAQSSPLMLMLSDHPF